MEAASIPAGQAAVLAESPRWFAQAIDAVFDQVLLVERSEADFRGASFLDDRSLTPSTPRQIVPWSMVEQAMAGARRDDAHYIFHIGHVGSTLVSRLLGELPAFLALREPLLLRAFHDIAIRADAPECPWSDDELDRRLATLRALLSRTFRPDQRAMVKATSFTSELAPRLVAANARALLMFASPRSYLENILAGEESRREIHLLAGARLHRLARRQGEPRWRLWELGEGERAALGWACEMLSLDAAASALGPDRILYADFDAFLADPVSGLSRYAAFFGEAIPEGQAAALVGGPLMGRYSKAPEYAYSPALRAQVLAQSRAENPSSIRAGLAWLERAATHFPALAGHLQQA